MELQLGRPADCSGRLDKELRVYDLLDGLGVSYGRVDHQPAMTMEACIEIDAAMGAPMCKNLLLCNRQCTNFYLLLMPGKKPVKTNILSKQLGTARLSFADGKYMEEYLDITPGALSVLGLMNDKNQKVQLLIDDELLGWEYIGCHPCVNTSSLRLKKEDLLERIIPAMEHTPQFVHLETEIAE